MFEKPIVGHRLGDALVSLLDRMNEFRPDPEENLDDLLAYIDNLSYTDFRDCPDHALAILNFAEAFENRELWTDAFVHCSGMNDELVTSTEFMVSPAASSSVHWSNWNAVNLQNNQSPHYPSSPRNAHPPGTCRHIPQQLPRGRSL